MSTEPRPSQTVAAPATNGSGGDVSQLSQSQPEEFPIEVLPYRVLLFVLEAAEALGVDPALVAGPCLAALAGCIGNRRRIVVNPGTWTEACVLWVAVVQRSGGKKTPAMSMALDYPHEREAAAIEEERERRADYEQRMQEWQASNGQRGEKPEEPEPALRLVVSDITTEALLSVHAKSPLGLLLHRDELAGLLRGFNQYKSGGKGNDAQTWTEMHQGKPCIIDRKASGTLSVPRAAVSIVGGIQPELLRAALCGGEHLFDGVAARFLFVAVPDRPKRWTDKSVTSERREDWHRLLDELLSLQPNGDGTPIDLPMTADAKAALVDYYNAHAHREHAEENGPLRSTMSKLEAATARLALVIQLATDPQSTEVDLDAMKAGIALSNWFEGQARRVYSGIEESEQEQDRRAALEWIADQGGKTSRRELTRLGPYRLRPKAQQVLNDLEAEGLVKLSPRSGQGVREYLLCDCDTCDTEKAAQ